MRWPRASSSFLNRSPRWSALPRLQRSTNCQPPVAVRVNPDFELKSSGMKMGGGPRPFGVDAEQVPELLQRIADTPLRFMGLHIFTGSQNLRHEALIEAHDQTFALAERLAADSPLPVRWLNIGGGLGIPYFPGEQPWRCSPCATICASGCPPGARPTRRAPW